MLKIVDGEYADRFDLFGDPVLDTLSATERKKPERKARTTYVFPDKCPACGEVKVLVRGYYVTICQECHDFTDELVRNPRW